MEDYNSYKFFDKSYPLSYKKVMMRILLILLFVPGLFLPDKLFGRERFVPGNVSALEESKQPWFTGPLLASGPTTIPAGHVNVQPYFFATQIPARYDKNWEAQTLPTFWTLTTAIPLWIGLTSWLDIEIQPQFSWNHLSGVGGHWALGDSIVQIDFQLYRDDFPAKSWIPSIKFAIREGIPTGKYRNLGAEKGPIEVGGLGSWSTTFIVVVGRLIHLSGVHYLTARFNAAYTLFAPVHVKGFNTYGGAYGTNGMVYPKSNLLADLAFEVSLTKQWVFALDLVARWGGGNTFSGQSGILPDHLMPSLRNPGAIQYSIAPAIEYNFNANLGIIAGPWITLAGKDANKFYTGVISLNYYK
jgi:hypothetical protein